MLGLPVGDQLMVLYHPQLEGPSVLGSAELEGRRNGERLRVAGLVVIRQSPHTPKGLVFITLEDEEGLVNVIVRPDVYERSYRTMRNGLLLLVEGTIQKQSISRVFSTSSHRERWS